jgi:hypothetical protein
VVVERFLRRRFKRRAGSENLLLLPERLFHVKEIRRQLLAMEKHREVAKGV